MKQRVHQAAAKRIKILRPKKGKKARLLHRAAGQDHFNARESGTVTRAKRRGRELSAGYRKTIQTMIPGIS